MTTMYPEEVLGEDDDNGTMVANVHDLSEAVVGHRIVKVENGVESPDKSGWYRGSAFAITLDNGKTVYLQDTDDCCASTELQSFLLNADKVDHIITGVGTTGEYTTWHIYADMGDVLSLQVGWSCGNPFYYGYGFHITVSDTKPEASVEE